MFITESFVPILIFFTLEQHVITISIKLRFSKVH